MFPAFRFRPLFVLMVALTAVAFLDGNRVATGEHMVEDDACFPSRKFESLPAKAIGVLVSDGQNMLRKEGRSGPPDAFVFSRAGASYSWVYIPVTEKPQIEHMDVAVGTALTKQLKRFNKLSLATAEVLKPKAINGPYALVEVEVNAGLGSPSGESFVATRLKRLDNTEEYPLNVAKVISRLHKQYQTFLKEQKEIIEAGLKRAENTALGKQEPTGPRESSELLYVTWLPEREQLQVCFQTRVNDGLYKYGRGADPGQKKTPPVGSGANPPPDDKGLVRFGTVFGVELGMSFDVAKTGEILRDSAVPLRTFQADIPPPGGAFQSVTPGAWPGKGPGS